MSERKMTLDEIQEAFEEWAEFQGLCLDQLFMSTDGAPDNPYEDHVTRLCFEAWMQNLFVKPTESEAADE